MAPVAMNKNNSAVKRIMQEAKELANDPCTDYSAAPLEDDIFEWHCTLRGPSGTEFEGGLYHFRILLPAEYPFRPPSIMMLTPNGRFELNTKICISFTNYHEELWQPAWGVRTAIIGLQGFFPLKGQAAVGVGSIEYPSTERKRLAALSREWYCPHCKQTTLELLPNPVIEPSNSDSATSGSLASPPTTTNAESPSDQPPPIVVLETNPDPSPSSDESPNIVHEVGLIPSSGSTGSAAAGPTTPSFITHASRASPVEDVTAPAPATTVRRSSQKSPLILDTAICVLLVLVFALVCRRIL
ncbi:UBC-like protein [Pleurotus eryngii]|uniref:UBC-like protein n=1 Tax=Pleurotus eryngii TaxID=5323 RepID=A0A9P6DBF0_PLEER|nr:UBC-like protein [Pleurotus eryngii]